MHRSLDDAGIAHAFGGALALAYCTAEPRTTADIDLNVFAEPASAREVFSALPVDIDTSEQDVATVAERGQVRLRWEGTPLDLFFAYHPFHSDAASRCRTVPFGDSEIPVLHCSDVLVFKALFGRPRDWVDIEAIVEAGEVDLAGALDQIARLLGRSSETYERLARVGASDGDGSEAYRRAFGDPRGS